MATIAPGEARAMALAISVTNLNNGVRACLLAAMMGSAVPAFA